MNARLDKYDLMKKITIYIDGACSGNPGPGGWGGVILWNGCEHEIYGGEIETTNNQMELMAALNALNALKKPCQIDLYTDSTYVRNGISKWIEKWKKNGWRTNTGKFVKNVDLWKKLDESRVRHEIGWHWIRGHIGHVENERADALARKGISRIRELLESSKGN